MKRYWILALCVLLLFPAAVSGCASGSTTSGQRQMEGLMILVDAGHGDSDVGTIGPVSGVYEKDINLAISLKLQAALEEKGVNVVMTRISDAPLGTPEEEDVAVRKENDMQKREELIDGANANLLISIHQNQFDDPAAKGPQVFYLKYDDASYGVDFSKAIQNAVNRELRIENPRDVNFGNWRLLKKGNQPGCIVECGFLSNPEEELLLQDNDYQDQLVKAIVMGVEEYVKKYGA
ncbi:N-acetylmuramoyl-L-alanine amidase [Christensenellaceae bacterium OttesenSCG-928-M15]|nr:N-acetylmuramoyl-L-alanine amidase [Christensenellaceae bacterium OttesenSCG-928-M15]